MIRTCALACLLFLAGTLVLADLASAQTSGVERADTVYQVRLSDGSTVYGTIESRTPELIVLVTTGGVRMELRPEQVRYVRAARGRVVRGEYWPPDPNKTRLFFGPTGRSIGAGQGYIGTFFIALPFVAYGIGERVTLAGGVPILFGRIQPFYVAPKVEVITATDVRVAVGVLSVWSWDDADFDDIRFGVGFAVGTFGDTENAVTLGIGFGYAGDDVSGKPAFMLGGETRVSHRIKFITENYFVSGHNGGLVSGGIRVLGERLSVDVGMGAAVGEGSGCCAPIVNFAYSFGR